MPGRWSCLREIRESRQISPGRPRQIPFILTPFKHEQRLMDLYTFSHHKPVPVIESRYIEALRTIPAPTIKDTDQEGKTARKDA